MKFLVMGGRNRHAALGKSEWTQFDLAIAMLVDVAAGTTQRLIEYESPPEVTGPEDYRAVLFKAGTRVGDRLYVCTQTEVMVYSYPEMQRLRYLSLPCFNDLHHVRPLPNGNLLVVSTGLDMVFEVDPSDRIVDEWVTVEGSGWSRFDRNEDYRTWSTTKPHHSHPNYVFEINDRKWVTRFEQRDAMCLDDPACTMPIEVQRPHDGEHRDGRVYFTTVDAKVVVCDALTRKRIDVFDLNVIEGVKYSMGWCRGLHLAEDNKVVVGFSRIRPTRFRENIRWIKHKVGGHRTSGLRPSRIAMYDLGKRSLEWEFILEEAGLNAIFSIHAA